ncbi:uncharacterized protein LOC133402073 isoform X1 [Phycodurus eques]|uniref:uncharacterized protein LOC133402073 isoform X1 n=2 Tax=Phycodurus eques TaxID=693459 RepID=UPI002ACE7068|nr:uncharacterized protein LOC133402073 isoform X1 [Phycodurus eques]XP_061531631.1 uncharacterized protein LOC133402073 isoform X1 [Phycodurus eques]XP_061531632.1 uncharacterized protein LOC133402073 isoform X1 [Phycodurus eques]
MHLITMKTLMWFPLVLGALQQTGAELIHTKTGQRVTIKCGLGDFASSLVWRHSDDLVVQISGKTHMLLRSTNAIGSRSKVTQETNLEITAVEESDAGQFTCFVDNKLKVHTLVVVSVLVEPAGGLWLHSLAVLQCWVAGLPSDTVVHWRRPGGARRWDRGIARLDPVEASHVGKWECVFYHEVAEYTEEIEIDVKNIYMTTSTPSTKDLGYSPPPPVQPALPKLGWWLLVAGSLVVLLLLSLVLLLFGQIRRRKKRFLQMKNARKPMNARQYCQCRCPTAAAVPLRPEKKKKPPALPLTH